MKLAERSSWIDIARGIGILLVMYGHVFSSSSNKYLIYGFHLPLFFFISGFVSSFDTAKPFLLFLKKLILQILVPYLLYAIATFLFWAVILNHHVTSDGIVEQVKKLLFARSVDGYTLFNVPLWFLPCLFSTKLLFGMFVRITTKPKYLALLLIVSAGVSWLVGNYLFWKLPYIFEVSLSAVVFFGVGYLLKETISSIQFSRLQSFGLSLFTGVLYVLLATLHYKLSGSHVDMRINSLHNYVFFFLNAFLGISCVVFLCQLLRKNIVLEYLGRKSLILFVWHYPLYMYFTHALPRYVSAQTVEALKPLNPIGYTLAALLVILVIKECVVKIRILAKQQIVIASKAKQSS